MKKAARGGLTIKSGTVIMDIEKALRQAVGPNQEIRLSKWKPSPAGVAVSAFYDNRNRKGPDM